MVKIESVQAFLFNFNLNFSLLTDYQEPKNCYNPDINSQVSNEFVIALRFFHYFIRDNWGLYPSEIFHQVSGIRGQRVRDIEFHSFFENLDIFFENRCGLMHGLLDSSWNMFSKGLFCKLKSIFSFLKFFDRAFRSL